MKRMNVEKLKSLTRDLRQEPPRSPRDLLGGYVIAARCVDKCRAELLDVQGDYEYWPCSLAKRFFDFTGITPEALRDFIATGATDEEIGAWIQQHSRVSSRIEVIRWNNRMRELRISELPDESQERLETYIAEHLPKHRPVYVWFDVFDLEEGRL